MKQYFHLRHDWLEENQEHFDFGAFMDDLSISNLLGDYRDLETFNMGNLEPNSVTLKIESVEQLKALTTKVFPDKTDFLSLYLGVGFESFEEKLLLIESLPSAERKLNIPIYVEISRGTICQDLPTISELLKLCPDTKLIVDFSELFMSHELLSLQNKFYIRHLKSIAANIKSIRANIATIERNTYIAQDYILPPIPRSISDIHLRRAVSNQIMAWKNVFKYSSIEFVIIENPELHDVMHEYSEFADLSYADLTKGHQAAIASLLRKSL